MSEEKEVVVLEVGVPTLAESVIKEIVKVEKELKKLDKEKKAYKAALQKAMEKYEIKKFEIEDEGLTVTYVAPSTKEKFDSKAFRKDNPDLYDEYTVIEPSDGYLKISIG